MAKKKHFFDWRWDDEKLKSEYQLVIERSSEDKMYKEAKISGNDIVFTVNTKIVENDILKESTKEIHSRLDKYLKDLFIKKYSILDPIDLEAFLEYHFKAYKGDKKEFLKHIKTILAGMKVLNPFELNPQGKIEIGKLWIEEKWKSIASKLTPQKETTSLGNTTTNNTNNDLTFEENFKGKKFESDRILEILMDNGYIDENYDWLGSKVEYIALLHYLIENNLVRIKKYATLNKNLQTVIDAGYISKPTYKGAYPHIPKFEKIFKVSK